VAISFFSPSCIFSDIHSPCLAASLPPTGLFPAVSFNDFSPTLARLSSGVR
jgi:hypothetical protein